MEENDYGTFESTKIQGGSILHKSQLSHIIRQEEIPSYGEENIAQVTA